MRPDDLAILISSGSWGVGAVQETFELVANQPGLVPVVACGHNSTLRQQLEATAKTKGYRAHLLGWTDDMAGVMAACDVLVENAGGLTSLEAMRAGVPLVTFRPIPGHGRNSAAAMSAGGVSCLAHNGAELLERLELLGRPGPVRNAQLAAAADLFSGDAATAVAEFATYGPPLQPRLRPAARVARAVSAVTLAGALSWVGLTTGVGAAAAAGVGVAHPPQGASNVVYLGVRLNSAEVSSSVVQADVAHLDASAVVDVNTANVTRHALRALVTKGVDLESGGLGDGPRAADEPGAPWALALSDSESVQALSVLAGQDVDALVPDRSISAFDLVDASSAHLIMVVPNATLPVPPSGPFPEQELALPLLQGDHIYVVNGLHLTVTQLSVLLEQCRGTTSGPAIDKRPLPQAPVNRGSGARVAAGAAAIAVTAGVAHLLPAASSWRCLRNRYMPGLAGVGTVGHVALTFDDGPDPSSTPAFLDALDGLGWRATFFMLGSMAAACPDVAVEAARRGHEVAVHGYVHANHFYHGPRWTVRDMLRARDTIEDLTGTRPIVGPPSLRRTVDFDTSCCSASRLAPSAVDHMGPRLASRGDSRVNC